MSPALVSLALLAWGIVAIGALVWLGVRRARARQRQTQKLRRVASESRTTALDVGDLAGSLAEGALRPGRALRAPDVGGGGFHTTASFGGGGFRAAPMLNTAPETPLIAAALHPHPDVDVGGLDLDASVLDFDVGSAAEAVLGGVSEAVGAGLEVAGEAAAGIASAVLE